MSENFTSKASPSIEKAINESFRFEDIRSLALASTGLSRDREGNVVGFKQPAPAPLPVVPSTPVSRSGSQFMKVIYPHGNSRFELYADSDEDLVAQEQAILRSFGLQQ